ncbi:GNAT family N-acetyltransferase [Pseudosulfitobacter koreensis]|uniref:GNAT family N-acetyltransferase n=1 Tax=Pseudosulfitobacter koreensis TaxID=2968472 RepID=A0ABT1Z1S9_9RHOB|nr:GNAT family N-acetyltransferase [Pseudosulfitobacter koreense]MCR8827097.1 GNAT family N-acetyltransferase [Pseudosulfitobacter koreense]
MITTLPAAHAGVLEPLLRQVHDLHVAHQPTHYLPTPAPSVLRGFLTDWLAEPYITALVAGDPSAPVGYLIYEEERRAASVLKPARHRAVLHHICVDAGHRRKGIAAALIAHMRAGCRAAGIGQITVSYGAFNKASARTMAQAGLEPVTVVADGVV